MTALTSDTGCRVSLKLVELLEDARLAGPAARAESFGDRLDALEVEALETCAPGVTLMMIRLSRDVVDFAERIATRPVRPTRP